jgi:Zn-dependent protease with chaperone function
MELKMEPQVIESIKRYRRQVFLQKLAVLAPLALAISACVVALVVLTAAGPGDWKLVLMGENGSPSFLLWIFPLALAALLLLLAVRRGPEALVVAEEPGDGSSGPFRRALEGVSAAAGFPAPPLRVLDIPTANSLAFLEGRKPAVGVSREALPLGRNPRRAEAMMAHELAHVLTGELYPASMRRRFQLTGWAMISLELVLLTLVILMAGLSLWAGLLLLAVAPLLLFWAGWRSRFIGRHNDLLADSVAVKLTYDPEGFRETLEELDRLFMENREFFPLKARYPYYLFAYRVRPEEQMAWARQIAGRLYSEDQDEEFSEDMGKWIERSSRFPRATLDMRLRNLEAIDLGHWPAFKR